METQLSKSEKKRRAKGIEQMVHELVALPVGEIVNLPCDEEFFRAEFSHEMFAIFGEWVLPRDVLDAHSKPPTRL